MKIILNKAEKIFKDKAYIHGNILLFSPSDAIDVIQWCADHNIALLGIDAFNILPEGIQPIMEYGLDFTNGSILIEKGSEYDYAARWIANHDPSLYYEIVLAT